MNEATSSISSAIFLGSFPDIVQNILVYKVSFLVTIIGSLGIIAFTIFNNIREKFNFLYALLNISVLVWAIGRYLLLITNDHSQALLYAKVLYIGSILIFPLFLHAILVFVGKERSRRWIIFFFYVNASILSAINLHDIFTGSNNFVLDVVPKLFFPFYEVPNTAYNFHLIQYLFIPQYAFVELLLALKREKETRKRGQIQFILASSVLGFIGGNSVVPLVYNIAVPPIAAIFVPLNFIMMTYAVFRYGLMNFKIIATEIAVSLVFLVLAIEAALSKSTFEVILRGALLVLVGFFGYLLIKSVYKEIEQRERIEKLAKELETANERLKDLDRQKSEFVSIASHQLRSPLTAIKGYASLVLENSYGPVSDKVRMAVDRIFQSSQSLVIVIENFLNISRIEQGRMRYDFAPVELTNLTQQIVNQLLPNAEKKGLKISFISKTQPPVTVQADADKLRQVILNFVDNSIKYTPTGSIEVILEMQPNGHPRIVVSDTGIGMKKETIEMLFQKFSRAEGASKVNAGGAGLGLFLASEIMKAHHGSVRAESDGLGKGSRFIIEFGA